MWNMFYKVRTESRELKIMEVLNARADLSEKDKRNYFTLRKGYEGEIQFDNMLERLQCDCLILSDLLLRASNSTFQIDSLIIVSNTVYLFDIKNYEDDYVWDAVDNRMLKKPDFEITNPLTQLKKNEQHFRKWLQEHKLDFPVVASVVFVNPRFTLYQASPDLPFIFPTQIERDVIERLNSNSAKLTHKHKKFADQLINSHINENPYSQIPAYEYEELRKGILCANCSSISVFLDGKFCFCPDCGHKETVEAAVIRTAEEFRLLFPERKLTARTLMEYSKVINNQKRMSRILEKHFTMVGKNRWVHYI